MARRKDYPSDLTDAEWTILASLLPPPKRLGRPARVDRREVVNAILYVLRTGCQWRYLPEGFPNWNTVYWYFLRWQDDGTWERITDSLRRRLRLQLGRNPEPSATERGARGGTMQASRSRDASAISWSTPRAS
jgi:putative transposase